MDKGNEYLLYLANPHNDKIKSDNYEQSTKQLDYFLPLHMQPGSQKSVDTLLIDSKLFESLLQIGDDTIKSLEGSIKELLKAAEDIKKSLLSASADQKALLQVREQLNQAQINLQKANEEKNKIGTELSTLKTRQQQLEKEKQTLQTDLITQNDIISKLQNEQTKTRSEILKLQTEVNQKQKEVNEKQKEIEDLNQENASMNQDISKLEESLQIMKDVVVKTSSTLTELSKISTIIHHCVNEETKKELSQDESEATSKINQFIKVMQSLDQLNFSVSESLTYSVAVMETILDSIIDGGISVFTRANHILTNKKLGSDEKKVIDGAIVALNEIANETKKMKDELRNFKTPTKTDITQINGRIKQLSTNLGNHLTKQVTIDIQLRKLEASLKKQETEEKLEQLANTIVNQKQDLNAALSQALEKETQQSKEDQKEHQQEVEEAKEEVKENLDKLKDISSQTTSDPKDILVVPREEALVYYFGKNKPEQQQKEGTIAPPANLEEFKKNQVTRRTKFTDVVNAFLFDDKSKDHWGKLMDGTTGTRAKFTGSLLGVIYHENDMSQFYQQFIYNSKNNKKICQDPYVVITKANDTKLIETLKKWKDCIKERMVLLQSYKKEDTMVVIKGYKDQEEKNTKNFTLHEISHAMIKAIQTQENLLNVYAPAAKESTFKGNGEFIKNATNLGVLIIETLWLDLVIENMLFHLPWKFVLNEDVLKEGIYSEKFDMELKEWIKKNKQQIIKAKISIPKDLNIGYLLEEQMDLLTYF